MNCFTVWTTISYFAVDEFLEIAILPFVLLNRLEVDRDLQRIPELQPAPAACFVLGIDIGQYDTQESGSS